MLIIKNDMNLSEEDKKRLEEEESYRKKVGEEEKYREEIRNKLNKPKTSGKAWMFLLLFPLVIGILALNSSTNSREQKNIDSNPASQTNLKASEEQKKKEEEQRKQQIQELSVLFCSERSKSDIRYVNLEDFITMYEASGGTVNLRPAMNVKPLAKSCEKIADICLRMWNSKECKDIAETNIWIGMSEDQLILSWGLPNDRNNSVYSFGVNSQWVYGNPIYGADYVYLEGKDKDNMKVTSWQD